MSISNFCAGPADITATFTLNGVTFYAIELRTAAVSRPNQNLTYNSTQLNSLLTRPSVRTLPKLKCYTIKIVLSCCAQNGRINRAVRITLLTARQSALGLMFAEFRGGAPVRSPLNTPLAMILCLVYTTAVTCRQGKSDEYSAVVTRLSRALVTCNDHVTRDTRFGIVHWTYRDFELYTAVLIMGVMPTAFTHVTHDNTNTRGFIF